MRTGYPGQQLLRTRVFCQWQRSKEVSEEQHGTEGWLTPLKFVFHRSHKSPPLPEMQKVGAGSIVNLSSEHGVSYGTPRPVVRRR